MGILGAEYGLLMSFRFHVCFGGVIIGFRSVSGLACKASFTPLAVGGMNSGPWLLPAPVTEPGRLTFERGRHLLGSLLPLSPGMALPAATAVTVDNGLGIPAAVYEVDGPVLEAIELSDLHAAESAVAIERFVVVHRGIREMKLEVW